MIRQLDHILYAYCGILEFETCWQKKNGVWNLRGRKVWDVSQSWSMILLGLRICQMNGGEML